MKTVGALFIVALAACGAPEPSPAEIATAQRQTEKLLQGSQDVRAALEVLGLLPTYTCGSSPKAFVNEALPKVKAELACVSAIQEGDATVLSFLPPCSVRGHTVNGKLRIEVQTAESRVDVSADANDLEVDGRPLRTELGYSVCGDEESSWAKLRGDPLASGDPSVALDVSVKHRPGLPILGSSTLTLDGLGVLAGESGLDRVTSTALEYELGTLLPKSGELKIEPSAGREIRIHFTPLLWRLGKAELEIEGRQPVVLPVAR